MPNHDIDEETEYIKNKYKRKKHYLLGHAKKSRRMGNPDQEDRLWPRV